MTRKTQRRIRKWLNWKTGAAALAVLVVILGVGQIFGLWATLWQGLFGTAGPAGGYACLPTCVGSETQNDGKFLLISGEDMATFAGSTIVVWVSVPNGNTSFELDFFDGDAGLDNSGNVNRYAGNWDDGTTETTYTLYADPLRDGSGTGQVRQWSDRTMLNNRWYDDSIPTDGAALDAAGDYYNYRLEITRPTQGAGGNAFKLRSTGYLTSGRSDLLSNEMDLVDASFSIVGAFGGTKDMPLLYPQFSGNWSNVGPSSYSGEWDLYLNVKNDTVAMELWDGDFDRGTSSAAGADTDDPNTTGRPAWAVSAVDEGVGGVPFGLPPGQGDPADNNWWSVSRRTDPVWYEILDPQGSPIYKNGEPGNANEPSGTQEWEYFSITSDQSRSPAADLSTGELEPGLYTFHIVGLDLHNLVFLRTNLEICSPEGCPDEPPRTCPRTIGYWKNNVKKILIEHKTKGVQETADSIHRALDLIALASPLYRSGINVANPEPIANPVRLTDQEVHAIMQKSAGNTMLDRALQQNLATWLNLMSGKLNKTTVISLNWGSGTFDGTVWQSLQEAQTIMLNATDPNQADLERAKSTADQINNGLLGENADSSTCGDYTQVMPPDKQPPDKDNKPKGPKPAEPPAPVVGCDNPRTNQYGVENPTNNPFYGIKFEYQSGTEVKDGLYDEFQIVLPADVVGNMSAVQMEAKAGENVGQVTLQGCEFNAVTPCEPSVLDPNGFFEFGFMGARDNSDGTLTLVFWVKNLTGNGLSHATIGLPDGVVPASPGGSYQSQVCP